jgi:hypothetical protein
MENDRGRLRSVRPFWCEGQNGWVEIKKKEKLGVVPHACNPSYSGDRDQEDRSQLRVRAYLEKTHHKRKDWWSGSSDKVPT